MANFVGRTRELAQLGDQVGIVRRGGRDASGVAVLMRGRRRIGKSRLAEVFAEGSGAALPRVPSSTLLNS